MSKRVLSKESEFFKAKCSGRWPINDGVDLTDIPVHIFGIFLVWLSSGSVADYTGNILALHNYEVVPGSEFTMLIHCYLLVDRLLARKFQNCIADEICYFMDSDARVPTDETIFDNVPLVYRTTPRESALRHILQDAALRHLDPSTMAIQVAENPQDELLLAEFWKELAIRGKSWLEDPSMCLQGDCNLYKTRFQCRYHQHKTEDEKRLCRKSTARMGSYGVLENELNSEFPTLVETN